VSGFCASVTVDVDGVAGLPDGGAGSGRRLTSRSERLYGVERGLERVLDTLAAHGVRATFYVPGVVAWDHPDAVREIVSRGHEIGHHGHTHRRPDTLSDRAQRRDLIAGIDALTEIAGVTPRGYRAPGWELAPATLAALAARGFTHDSSLMGDDRPYVLAGGVLELPVHWALDDAPWFERDLDPRPLLAAWTAEAGAAAREARHVTYTLHPEILGRAHRVAVLDGLLDHLAAMGARLLTHDDVVRELATAPPR
jgi:peptidoglycan/xylan/chitin deacetylase (PgdA/CDA1 family)